MIKKSFNARTEKIQKELDDAAGAKVTAESDAKNIRAALGDIAGERARMLAEADTQATAVLTEGRARITAEVAELEAKAEADLNSARGRSSDELRAEIALLSSIATPVVVQATLNDQTKNELIESFISSVGAGR
jgi:F-type H+-transporting ATPase subunit b